VENTGTGFAPYFSSLALWIGALLISLIIGRRVDKSRLKDADGANFVLGRFMLFAVCGVVQAALLTVILFALGINVRNGLLTCVALGVSGLCCIALVSTLIGIFGMFGQKFQTWMSDYL
jgi:putative membrane protein